MSKNRHPILYSFNEKKKTIKKRILYVYYLIDSFVCVSIRFVVFVSIRNTKTLVRRNETTPKRYVVENINLLYRFSQYFPSGLNGSLVNGENGVRRSNENDVHCVVRIRFGFSFRVFAHADVVVDRCDTCSPCVSHTASTTATGPVVVQKPIKRPHGMFHNDHRTVSWADFGVVTTCGRAAKLLPVRINKSFFLRSERFVHRRSTAPLGHDKRL